MLSQFWYLYVLLRTRYVFYSQLFTTDVIQILSLSIRAPETFVRYMLLLPGVCLRNYVAWISSVFIPHLYLSLLLIRPYNYFRERISGNICNILIMWFRHNLLIFFIILLTTYFVNLLNLPHTITSRKLTIRIVYMTELTLETKTIELS